MSIETAANRKSASRGYDYYYDNKVKSVTKIDDTHYSGEVLGSEPTPYSVTIDLEHPKRSKCTCPFANGYKVCKHMVALYFKVFPEEAHEYIRRIKEAENEREEFFEELPERIEEYVRNLTKSELQELALSLNIICPIMNLKSLHSIIFMKISKMILANTIMMKMMIMTKILNNTLLI